MVNGIETTKITGVPTVNGAPGRISLAVLPTPQNEDKAEEHSASQEHQLWKNIEWLTMNNQYAEAIPLALNWLISQDLVNPSDCIKVAGICMLGKEHNVYESIISMMPKKGTKALSNDQKTLLGNFKASAEEKSKTKQLEREKSQERVIASKTRIEFGPNAAIFETTLGSEKASEALRYVTNIATLVENNQTIPRMDIVHAVSTLNLEGFYKEANELIKFITNEYNVKITKEDIKLILAALIK